VEKVHEVFDLVRLKNISEGGHGRATIVNLMLDLLLLQAFSDGAEVWSQVPSTAIYAVTMLASLFVEECRPGVLTFAGVGVNDLSGRSWQTACQSYYKGRETQGNTDSRRDFAVTLQRNGDLSAMIYRGWRGCSY
jgi:hypothetical protein